MIEILDCVHFSMVKVQIIATVRDTLCVRFILGLLIGKKSMATVKKYTLDIH